MKKNIKKNKFWFIGLISAFIMVLSFSIISLPKNDNVVFADSMTYNFKSSNFYIPLTPQVFTGHSNNTIDIKNNNSVNAYTDFATYLCTTNYFSNESDGSISIDFSYSFIINYFNGIPLFINNNFYVFDSTGSRIADNLAKVYFTSADVNTTKELYFVSLNHTADYENGDYNAYGFNVQITFGSSIPSFDFRYCNLSSFFDYQNNGNREGYLITNYVAYYDKDNNYIEFGYRSYFPFNSDDCCFDNRTYYFASALSASSQESYNEGYYNGQVDGSESGYTEGYQAGVDYVNNNVLPGAVSNAEQIGFDRGVQSANDYSFYGLISAVFDAPMTYFRSLLNFDLLGVNLLGFATALITLGIILFIVRKVI